MDPACRGSEGWLACPLLWTHSHFSFCPYVIQGPPVPLLCELRPTPLTSLAIPLPGKANNPAPSHPPSQCWGPEGKRRGSLERPLGSCTQPPAAP